MIATKRLCAVIENSIEEQNLDKLNAYLTSTDTTMAFNDTTLFTLKELLQNGKQQDKKSVAVDCVLSCLQNFVDKKISPDKWGVLEDSIGKLCEIVFNISATSIKEEQLLGKNVSTFTAILDHSKVVANSMLQFTMPTLLEVASGDTFSNAVMLDLLTLISSIMSKSTREIRKELIPKNIVSLDKLSNRLPICGDYEIQVATVDVLARSWYYLKNREDVDAYLFTNFPNVMKMFKTHNFVHLDTECRLFLNVLNNGMGDDQLVYSIPCLAVMIDQIHYKKPSDPTYKEFWVDFNIGAKSISFYYQTNPEESWEMKTFYRDDIESAKATNSCCKVRSGKVIPTIKVEITLKDKEENSEEPKLLKIFARKCEEFKKLESKAINELFQEKYKSLVTYEKLNTPPQTGHSPDSNESKPKEKRDRRTHEDRLNSTAILKWLNESDGNNTVRACTPLSEESGDQELNEPQDDSNNCLSFSHYIKQLKEQETNKKGKEAFTKNEQKNHDIDQINGKEPPMKKLPIASTPHSKYSSDKNLFSWNAAPEDVDISNIFPSTSLYPNRFESEKDTHLKNAYVPSKTKVFGKRKKTVFNELLFSSDSDDLDYINANIRPPTFGVKGEKRKVALNLESFVKSLPQRTDPIRNIKHMNDDMKIEPANLMGLDAPREIEVGAAVEPVCDVPQKGRGRRTAGVTKKNDPKKVNKIQKVKYVPTRKPQRKKGLDCSENSVENELHDAPQTLCSENYKSQSNEELVDDTFALDIQRNELFKDSEIPDTFPVDVMFVKNCLAEANTRVRNILTHIQKEREMYSSTFTFKTHASITILQDQIKKMMVINNNLIQVKSLLDTSINIQNEVCLQIHKEINQLEEIKRSFMKNISNQETKPVSMFQKLGEF